ncbi:MAG: hypothetical protein LBG17_04645 [Bacteroidales bacterium]|jgi:hypothetical protein|nr:hypothetical protein [Bacteroidales bacterium]
MNNNDNDLDYDEIAVLLAMGNRVPQNEDEEKLLQGIRQLEAEGKEVYFPV